MSLDQATTAIRNKRRALQLNGFDIGAAESTVQAAGSGGFVQAFANARLYWHPSTGAHEVHGNVLDWYLKLGGPGTHPQTGRREFGYPVADEERGLLGMEQSRFEFGTVHNVHGHRGVGVFGPFAGANLDSIGPPVSEPTRVPGGQALYGYEGCLFAPAALAGKTLRATLAAPLIGNPALLAPDSSRLPIKASMQIVLTDWVKLRTAQAGDAEASLIAMFEGLWTDRLHVVPVRGGQRMPVTMSATATPVTLDGPLGSSRPGMRIDWTARSPDRAAIADRTLLNLLFSMPGESLAIAPHAFYTAPTWRKFGFLHATDLHVSRRVEGFRKRLAQSAEAPGDSVRTMVNPNDSVRALFNYANKLYLAGTIDFLMVTGDLVDYVFEEGDDPRGGGNFRYLERLILGQAPSRDAEGVENRELIVPIFTVLGNHDYVVNPYRLLFYIDVPILSDKQVNKWYGFNMVKKDAEILEGGGRPTVSRDAAKKMAVSERSAAGYYHRRINRQSSYAVNLGDRHRLVMVDTGPNADGIDGNIDALQQWLNSGTNENERNFASGTPSSTSRDFPRLEAGLGVRRPPGVVIIGMHNPPLNTAGSEFPHYFRETERPGLAGERLESLVEGFLVRHGNVATGHPTWPLTGSRHFKTADINDFLDFGVVKWTDRKVMAFFELCEETQVDAVFCGHIHERVEFRVAPGESGGFRFFADFYTENPETYRESLDWGTGRDKRPIHIRVDPAAKSGGTVRIRRDRQATGIVESRELRVPPYGDPLDATAEKAAWWARHRPLILQTACLGPIDYSQRGARPTGGKTIAKRRVSFQGVRWVRVEGDSISLIKYVSMADIQAGKPPLPRPKPLHDDLITLPDDAGILQDVAPAAPSPGKPRE